MSLLLPCLLFSPGTLSNSGSHSILSLRGRVRATDSQLSRDYSALVHAAFPTEPALQSNDIWVIHDSPGQNIPMLNKEVAMHEANTKYSFSRGLCRKSQWAPLSNCFLRGTHACPFEDQSRGPSCGSTIRNPVGSAFNGHKLSDAYMVLLGIYVYLWVLNPTTSNLKAATSALAISMGIPMPLI